MSDFDNLKIKMEFGCGYVHRQKNSENLSDYWSEEEWGRLSENERHAWLDDFYEDWKSGYETGGIWIE